MRVRILNEVTTSGGITGNIAKDYNGLIKKKGKKKKKIAKRVKPDLLH
jgi:hypothetical protein